MEKEWNRKKMKEECKVMEARKTMELWNIIELVETEWTRARKCVKVEKMEMKWIKVEYEMGQTYRKSRKCVE